MSVCQLVCRLAARLSARGTLAVAALLRCCSRAQAAQVGDDDALAASIVEKADLVRFPGEGFEVSVAITPRLPCRDAESRKYKVLSKGNENTVVMITEPAAERGQIMLMKGRDLWVFLPTSRSRCACRCRSA